MMIAMIIILSLILVFEIAIFIVISAKERGCDERSYERTADEKKSKKLDDSAQRLIDEKKKREIEDYMRDIEALNKFGNDYENKK